MQITQPIGGMDSRNFVNGLKNLFPKAAASIPQNKTGAARRMICNKSNSIADIEM
jgi:hypothetical protein